MINHTEPRYKGIREDIHREDMSGKIGKWVDSLRPSPHPKDEITVPLVTTLSHNYLKSLQMLLFP